MLVHTHTGERIVHLLMGSRCLGIMTLIAVLLPKDQAESGKKMQCNRLCCNHSDFLHGD